MSWGPFVPAAIYSITFLERFVKKPAKRPAAQPDKTGTHPGKNTSLFGNKRTVALALPQILWPGFICQND